MQTKVRSTTVICVRRDNKVVMAGDGQVTLGHEVLKGTARKLRRLYNDKILAGFAGSTADAFSLFARFETKLEQFNGNLSRSVVELAKDWRTDKILAGFAGSTADAFSLFARFETKLEQFNGNLSRSVVELAKDWRTDKI